MPAKKKIDEAAVKAVVNEEPIVVRKPRKPKLVEVQSPDISDLEDDQIDSVNFNASLGSSSSNADASLRSSGAKYVLATDEEAATLGSDEPSGVEIQLGLLTARIEELNALVRNLAKKVEERGSSDSKPPRRDDRPSGDRPRGDFNDRPKRDFGDRPKFGDRDSRPPRRDFGDRPKFGGGDDRPKRDFGDRPRFERPSGGSDSRGSDSRGTSSDRPSGDRPARGFGRDGGDRSGGFKPREGGFAPRGGSDSRSSSDSRGGGDRGGFRPREGGSSDRGGSSSGGFRPREGGGSPDRGGFKPREGSFSRDSSSPRTEGGFKPREGGSTSSDQRGFGKRKDHGFTSRDSGSSSAPGTTTRRSNDDD